MKVKKVNVLSHVYLLPFQVEEMETCKISAKENNVGISDVFIPMLLNECPVIFRL